MITYNAITQESRKHKALDGQTLENNYNGQRTMIKIKHSLFCFPGIKHTTLSFHYLTACNLHGCHYLTNPSYQYSSCVESYNTNVVL